MKQRILGKSGIEVSAMGLGCWAIGGPHTRNGNPIGWGDVDDDESARAIQAALDIGVNFIDTADVYGCGHSERIIAKAIEGKREQVVIASKFGFTYDEGTKESLGICVNPEYIIEACDHSLRRLKTDYIDLYQLHPGDCDHPDEILETLIALKAQGKIRSYGWSTDNPANAEIFAKASGCAAIQQGLHLFYGSEEVLSVCEKNGVASISRSPLGMGILTGKYDKDSKIPANDVRADWWGDVGETQGKYFRKLEAIKDILTSDGRSLAQGALAWIWARSPVTVPIPGFRSVKQVKENAGALDFGPLRPEQLIEIEKL